MNESGWVGFLDRKCVMIDLAASAKGDAIEAMIAMLEKAGVVSDIEKFRAAVFEREELGSTGLGERVAMPHGKCDAVIRMTVAVARLAAPLDFESVDGKPVSYVFMVAAPTNNDPLYIKTMASIIRSVKMQGICGKMDHLDSADAIYEMLAANCA